MHSSIVPQSQRSDTQTFVSVVLMVYLCALRNRGLTVRSRALCMVHNIEKVLRLRRFIDAFLPSGDGM